jgi:hypothetical protein
MLIIKSYLKISFVFLLILTLNTNTFSQNKNYIGVTLTSEYTSNDNIRAGLGLTFERQMTVHVGLETGFYYRTNLVRLPITNDINNSFQVIESYISFPVLFKYYSHIVNVSFGPSVDYFFEWHEINPIENLKLTSYNINPHFFFGVIGKISKTIKLSDKFILEPEIRFNPLFKDYSYYLGLGIALKYRL